MSPSPLFVSPVETRWIDYLGAGSVTSANKEVTKHKAPGEKVSHSRLLLSAVVVLRQPLAPSEKTKFTSVMKERNFFFSLQSDHLI